MSLNVPSGLWRLSTDGGIKYKLISFSGTFSRDEATATQVYLIRKTMLSAFALESLPIPYVLLNTIFYPPARPLPGFLALRTTRISWRAFPDDKPVDPFGVDLFAPFGTYANDVELTIEYAPKELTDPNDPTTFLDISADVGIEFLNSPTRGSMEWLAEGGPEEVKEGDVPHVVKSFEVDWNIRWGNIPQDFFNASLLSTLRTKLGMVNEDVIPFLGSPPAETILFSGFSFDTKFTWQGGNTVNLDLKFVEKNFVDTAGEQVNHNMVWRPGHGWQRLQFNEQSIFQLTNLGDMFLPS